MLKPIHVLLVEDSPSDAKLLQTMMQVAKLNLRVDHVGDGAAALDYLFQRGAFTHVPRPDMVLLDLNLPKVSGFEVLEEVKADPNLKVIPVVVMTSSASEEDVLRSYQQHANCYVTKPVDFEQFQKIVQTLDAFWFTIVRLPPKE